jgi:hypothetical protein
VKPGLSLSPQTLPECALRRTWSAHPSRATESACATTAKASNLLHKVPTQIRPDVLNFRAWPDIRQCAGNTTAPLITYSFVHRNVGMGWPSMQLIQSTIRDDGGKPGRHLCSPSELIQILVGRQERILHRVFSVVWVSDVAICPFVRKDRFRETTS